MPAIRSIIQFGAASAVLFVSVSANSDPLPNPPQSYFGDYGYCALILRLQDLQPGYTPKSNTEN